LPEFAGIYERSFASQEKEMLCGERDQVSEHESGLLDRRECGGWLFVFVLVEVTLQVCKHDPEPLDPGNLPLRFFRFLSRI
jgi:hypothetical protein